MPGHVNFHSVEATFSRLALDDELYVMRAFTRHCRRCAHCDALLQQEIPSLASPSSCNPAASPYQRLCSRGNRRANDVDNYLTIHADKICSRVELERGQRIEVETGAEFASILKLLHSIARGYKLRPSSIASSTSSDDDTDLLSQASIPTRVSSLSASSSHRYGISPERKKPSLVRPQAALLAPVEIHVPSSFSPPIRRASRKRTSTREEGSPSSGRPAQSRTSYPSPPISPSTASPEAKRTKHSRRHSRSPSADSNSSEKSSGRKSTKYYIITPSGALPFFRP